MNKVEKDGKIAVVYSPGFGAGWSSWNPSYPEILFDPTIVDFVENNKYDELKIYMTLKYPDAYLGGIDDLTIAWITKGTDFRIREYDGSEHVEIKDEVNWLNA